MTHAPIPLCLAFGALFSALSAPAQSKPADWPFPSRSPGAGSSFFSPSPSPSSAPRSTPPPFDVALRQESWEQLPNREIRHEGTAALALRPQQWRHGETENFIFHYRGLGDALQIAREIEFDLWYVAQSLGAPEDAYTSKSHVYAFADEKEWQKFVALTHKPPLTHSFACTTISSSTCVRLAEVSIRRRSRTRRRTRSSTGAAAGRSG